jgi:hypothetical protein
MAMVVLSTSMVDDVVMVSISRNSGCQSHVRVVTVRCSLVLMQHEIQLQVSRMITCIGRDRQASSC